LHIYGAVVESVAGKVLSSAMVVKLNLGWRFLGVKGLVKGMQLFG